VKILQKVLGGGATFLTHTVYHTMRTCTTGKEAVSSQMVWAYFFSLLLLMLLKRI